MSKDITLTFWVSQSKSGAVTIEADGAPSGQQRKLLLNLGFYVLPPRAGRDRGAPGACVVWTSRGLDEVAGEEAIKVVDALSAHPWARWRGGDDIKIQHTVRSILRGGPDARLV